MPKLLKYIDGSDHFLHMFVQIVILFVQKRVAKMSELVQGAVRVRSIKGLENEQKRPKLTACGR